MTRVTHKVSNGGVEGLLKRVAELASHKIEVGVAQKDDKEGRKGEVGNADLIYIHTNGARIAPARHEMQKEINKGTKYSIALQMYMHEHGSQIYRIPARPIIEPAIDNAKAKIADEMKQALESALNGDDYMDVLKGAGQFARDEVKDWFTNSSNGWAPNAKSTIEGWTAPWIDPKTGKHPFFKGKGSNQPLIDTGKMRQAISFTIDGKDGSSD
jgi:hypothetical protein